MKTHLTPSVRIKSMKFGLCLIFALVLANALLVSCVDMDDQQAPAALGNIETGDVALVKQ